MAADKKKGDGAAPAEDIAGLSPTSILKVIHDLVPAKRRAWLESHWAALTPDAKATIAWGKDTAYFGDDADIGDFLDDHRDESAGGKVVVADLAEVAATRVAAALDGAPISGDLDLDGTIRSDEKAEIDKATGAAAKSQTEASGVDAGKAATERVSGALGIPTGGQVPDWVRNAYQGNIPDAATTRELISDWNDNHPSEQIATADDLWDKLKTGGPQAEELIAAQLGGRDPIIQQVYNIASFRGTDPSQSVGARTVAVTKDAFTIANGAWGADPRLLGEIMRAANRAGLLTPDGKDVAWQPLASLLKMVGDNFAKPAGKTSTAALGQSAETEHGAAGAVAAKASADKAVESRSTILSRLALAYKTGLETYRGDATLAALYASGNKALVDRMTYRATGDLDATDQAAAQQVLLRGGWNTEDLRTAGYATASPWYDNIFGSMANAYGGLGNDRLEQQAAKDKAAARQNYITTNKADPETIKQSVVDMWQELFDAKPSDSQIAVVAGKINALVESRAAAAGLPDQNTTNVATDVGAQVRAAAEGSADYAKFYGNKPAGMSDADYHNQFKAGAASLLGNQAADPQSIRGGLATGDYQTTIGSVAGSSQAWGNSQFMNRMAQAAIAINGAT